MSNSNNINLFQNLKNDNKKISMITCYDFTFAQIINNSDINCILVGDSAAMTMHGHPNTICADIAMMEAHTKAVVNGAPDKFVIADLPFLSYRKDLTSNMNSIHRLMQAGASAVKLEGADGNLDLIKHIVESGVPVMGHIGLTPQAVHQLGGFKVQGKTKSAQDMLKQQAIDLESAGCFAIVLECVPEDIAKEITNILNIPTIGIGAGNNTSGQVLVLQDLLGLNKNFKPKFVKKFAQGYDWALNAINDFHSEVRDQTFPDTDHSFKNSFKNNLINNSQNKIKETQDA